MDVKENSQILNSFTPEKKDEAKDESPVKKYIMWENKSNICWLDASMALIAHNKVLKRYSHISPISKINKIISVYEEAISVLNNTDMSFSQRIILSRAALNDVQDAVLQYLQPRLKYKTGDPESAFCSLYNLLIQDPVLKSIFDVTWISAKECINCGHQTTNTKKKPIITLSKIDSFNPENPCVLYQCTICNRSGQKMKLSYITLPPCLIFHFENGAGKEPPPSSFSIQKREYLLTGIMTLEKAKESNVNHFITWVRDPATNKWLDCNDLNLDVIYFSPNFPNINLEDVYMYVYESFDDLGVITIDKALDVKKSDENIICIDISEESDSENSQSKSVLIKPDKDANEAEAQAKLQPCSDTLSEEPDNKNKSQDLIESADNKRTKNSPASNSNEDLKSEIHRNSEVLKKISNKIIPPKTTVVGDSNKPKATLDKTLNEFDMDKKEITENNHPSDDGEQNELDKHIENSCSGDKLPLEKNKTSSVFGNKPQNTKVDSKKSMVDSSSMEIKSFIEDKGQDCSQSPMEQELHNKSPSTTGNFICSSALREKTSKLKSSNSENAEGLYSQKSSDSKNNPESFSTNSSIEQHNIKELALNSDSELPNSSERFLSRATAISSETSYVKLSLKRKKNSLLNSYKNRSLKSVRNPWSDKHVGNKPENSKVDSKKSMVDSSGMEIKSFIEDKGQDCSQSPMEQELRNKSQSTTGNFICTSTLREKSSKLKNSNSVNSEGLYSQKSIDLKNNPESFSTNSSIEQHNIKELALNSDSELPNSSGHFLSRATAISSETSYVKLSLKQKKIPLLNSYKNRSLKSVSNPRSDKHLYSKTVRSCTNFAKRSREIKEEIDEDSEDITPETPKEKLEIKKSLEIKAMNQKPRISNFCHKRPLSLKSDARSLKNKRKMSDMNDYCSSEYVKTKRKSGYQQIIPEQSTVIAEVHAVPDAVNPKANFENDAIVLKGFEDKWSHHTPGCNCHNEDFDEILDSVIGVSFAYLCKLEKEFEKY